MANVGIFNFWTQTFLRSFIGHCMKQTLCDEIFELSAELYMLFHGLADKLLYD